MPALRFHHEDGSILRLRMTEPRLTSQMKQVLMQESRIRFNVSGMELIADQTEPSPSEKPCFFAWQRVEVLFESTTDRKGPFTFLLNSQAVLVSSPHESVLFGSFSLQGAVGLSEFELQTSNGRQLFQLEIEVFPQKIGYKSDFQKMIQELDQMIHRLAFDQWKRSYSLTDLSSHDLASLPDWIAKLRVLSEELEQSINRILRQPSRHRTSREVVLAVEEVYQASPKLEAWISRNPQYLRRPQDKGYKLHKGIYVSHLPARDRSLSYDTSENRYVRWAIYQILDQLDKWEHRIQKRFSISSEKPVWISALQQFRHRLKQKANHPYFREVPLLTQPTPVSSVLQMGPGYREFYKRFLSLRKALMISLAGVFHMDLKEISTLYEYWCFLKIIHFLKTHPEYEMTSQSILTHDANQMVLRLRKGEESFVEFRHKTSRRHLRLWYNRPFGKGDSFTFRQIPDMVLEIEKPSYDQSFRFLIEVKYQFDRGSTNYPRSFVPHGPPLEAIAQLHRYRDAIVSDKQIHLTHRTAWKIIGGVVLFPFPDDEEDFTAHPFYQSISEVEIGAIPLHPGPYRQHRLMKDWLYRLLEFTPEAIYEQVIDYDRREQQERLELIEQAVLVCVLPNDGVSRAKIDHMQQHQRWFLPVSPEMKDCKHLVFMTSHTKEIVAIAHEVEEQIMGWEQLIEKGIDRSLIKKNQMYQVWRWKKISGCQIPFSTSFAVDYFVSNCLALEFARNIQRGDVLLLDSYAWFRAYQEVIQLDNTLEITLSDDREPKDTQLRFSWNKSTLICRPTDQSQQFQLSDEDGQSCFWSLPDPLLEVLTDFYRKTRTKKT